MDVSKANGQNVGINVGTNVGITKTRKRVLQCLLEQPDLTAKALAAKLGLSSRTIERALQNLQKANVIQRVGSRKDGSWLVVKSE